MEKWKVENWTNGSSICKSGKAEKWNSGKVEKVSVLFLLFHLFMFPFFRLLLFKFSTGGWREIRSLRKPRQRTSGKLRDKEGHLVDSEQWAGTMANHLERVQWHVRPAGIVDGPVLGDELPVYLGAITRAEVEVVLKRLKKGMASGQDDIPA